MHFKAKNIQSHAFFRSMSLNDFSEGDFVGITGKDGYFEPGWIMDYHARGEKDLVPGLVWLNSGRYICLLNAYPQLLQSLSKIRTISSLPLRDEFGAVRVVLGRKRNSPSKVGPPACHGIEFMSEISTVAFNQRGDEVRPFFGALELSRKFNTLHSIISSVEKNSFMMKRLKNKELREISLRKLLKDPLKGRTEGIWMNPTISQASLKYFGIPKGYLNSGKKLVRDYNQLIFQVDGTDRARTLGMHKDRDENDKPVNTILGCVGGDGGKEVILWMSNKTAEDMPRWWRNEGMSRESFELAKAQCKTVPSIASQVRIFTLYPGFFVYMPKNTYHWVCPGETTSWTVMVTSSFY
jgi:hypothetical protein